MLKIMMDMYKRVKDMFRGIFGNKLKSSGYMGTGQSFQRRSRSKGQGLRRFTYIGIDNKTHSVRVGKPFPVRPLFNAGMVMATRINRELLQVRV